MINPATFAIAEFPIPSRFPNDITAGPDGNLWFTETYGQMGMINPTTHAITEFPSGPNTYPEGITAGPDGNLWFADLGGRIGTINLTTHAVAEFPTLRLANTPIGITTGPDGNLWFTELDGQIGMINPKTHAISEFPTPTAKSRPFGITTGPDGNLWFTEEAIAALATIGQIGRVVIDPSVTGVVSVVHAKKQITAIVLAFNEVMNSDSVKKRSFYILASGVKKHHMFVSRNIAKIGAVSYDSISHTVKIRLAKPSKGPLQVTAKGGILGINGAPTQGTFAAVVD